MSAPGTASLSTSSRYCVYRQPSVSSPPASTSRNGCGGRSRSSLSVTALTARNSSPTPCLRMVSATLSPCAAHSTTMGASAAMRDQPCSEYAQRMRSSGREMPRCCVTASSSSVSAPRPSCALATAASARAPRSYPLPPSMNAGPHPLALACARPPSTMPNATVPVPAMRTQPWSTPPVPDASAVTASEYTTTSTPSWSSVFRVFCSTAMSSGRSTPAVPMHTVVTSFGLRPAWVRHSAMAFSSSPLAKDRSEVFQLQGPLMLRATTTLVRTSMAHAVVLLLPASMPRHNGFIRAILAHS
mmetsp:Transcript_15255/g.38028  ORF Transcript_15255/g.38028 Transcript_15255/m.38028 type:complete len:300 (-) Transcript_15255:114-1013(-)